MRIAGNASETDTLLAAEGNELFWMSLILTFDCRELQKVPVNHSKEKQTCAFIREHFHLSASFKIIISGTFCKLYFFLL